VRFVESCNICPIGKSTYVGQTYVGQTYVGQTYVGFAQHYPMRESLCVVVHMYRLFLPYTIKLRLIVCGRKIHSFQFDETLN
jgi:hypothetical protein